MKSKKIAKIIYGKYDEKTNIQNGIVFFDDGSYERVPRYKVIDYIMEYAKQENITSRKKLFNNRNLISKDTSTINDDYIETTKNNILGITPSIETKEVKEETPAVEEEPKDEFDKDELGKKIEAETLRQIETEKALDKIIPPKKEENTSSNEEELSEEELNKILEDDSNEDIKDLDDYEEEEIKSLWSIFKNKSKKAKVVITTIGVAAIIGITSIFGMSLNKKSKTGTMVNDKTIETNNDDNNYTQSQFKKLSYAKLVDATKNQTQKTIMSKIGTFLDNYNGTFAGKHTQTNSKIKAALTWDETIALDLAYNDYSMDEIRSIYNNASIDATTLTNAYKSANLQLASSYVIEENSSYINLDNLVKTDEGKKFYTKYHDLFTKCKTTSGQEQINNVNAFYSALSSDFSIDVDDREVGMSHADSMNNLESYKLAIVPMVTATEMMFQNLEVDNTLSDKVIAYFNDIGLCNYANDKYSKDETIMLTATKDETNPYYETFKVKKIEELTEKNQYNIKDENRDLSELVAFKSNVNKEIIIAKYSELTGSTQTTYGSYTSSSEESTTTYEEETETITTTSRDEAVAKAGEEAVKEAESKADEEIAKQNEEAKKKAEQEAEEKRKQEQAAADAKKAQDEAAAKKENDGLQDKINDVNDKIDNGETANEKDFGQTDDGENKVDIDDDHSDKDGNIDDSVKDITTDGTDAVKPSTPLPTPTDEGATNGYPKPQTPSVTPNSSQSGTIIEEEEELTNEELADLMVQAMASEAYFDNSSTVYTKTK